MKFFRVVAACFIASAFTAQGGDFKELSKSEVREFSRAARAIDGAYRESRFNQIVSFGPGILSKYSSVQIQADGFAKDVREAYAKTDSLVAYSVLRIYVDSLRNTISKGKSLDELYQTLRTADRIEDAFASRPILTRFALEYADTARASARLIIEQGVPDFLAAAKRAGKVDQAYALIGSLGYKSAVPATARTDVLASMESAFYDALASNSAEKLRGFSKLYPEFRSAEVASRLEILAGDEIAFLLKRGSKDELLSFLIANPSSQHTPEIKRRLRPLLYNAAFELKDLTACQQFLVLFPEPSQQRESVLGLQAYLLQSKASDTARMVTEETNWR